MLFLDRCCLFSNRYVSVFRSRDWSHWVCCENPLFFLYVYIQNCDFVVYGPNSFWGCGLASPLGKIRFWKTHANQQYPYFCVCVRLSSQTLLKQGGNLFQCIGKWFLRRTCIFSWCNSLWNLYDTINVWFVHVAVFWGSGLLGQMSLENAPSPPGRHRFHHCSTSCICVEFPWSLMQFDAVGD